MKEYWNKSNLPAILLSIVLSLSLWTTVQLSSGKTRQETIYNVPVRILEESTLRTNTGFSVIEGQGATIRVDYEAIGASVAELNKRNMEDIYAEVSVGAITEPGKTKVRYILRYPDNLNISVRSTTPRLVEVWVDEITTREVRIEPYAEGTPAEGYLYDGLTPDHETVTVQGPAQVLSQISYARATLAAEGVTGSLTDLAEISFFDVEGNLLDAEDNHLEITSGEINLSLSVLKEGIVPLRVSVTEAPGISAGMAAIDIQPSTVKVRGEPLLVDRLAQEGIQLGPVDLGQLSEGGKLTRAIRTQNGVRLVSGEPATAEITVVVQGVATRVVQVSDIRVDLDSTEDWDAILVSGTVPVTIRGPQSLVEHFDEGRIQASASLEEDDLAPGLWQAALKVTLDSADGIAVIEAPETVSVLLRQPGGGAGESEDEASETAEASEAEEGEAESAALPTLGGAAAADESAADAQGDAADAQADAAEQPQGAEAGAQESTGADAPEPGAAPEGGNAE